MGSYSYSYRGGGQCPSLCYFEKGLKNPLSKTIRCGPVFVIAVLALLTAWPTEAVAQSAIRINELCFKPLAGEPQWVELYNSGKVQQDISGYALTDEDGSDYIFPAQLPPVPPGAFVVVHFDGLGSKRNDCDFSDNVAELHSDVGVASPFKSRSDQVSLYKSRSFVPDTIVSFVAWGESPGSDATNAVKGALWLTLQRKVSSRYF